MVAMPPGRWALILVESTARPEDKKNPPHCYCRTNARVEAVIDSDAVDHSPDASDHGEPAKYPQAGVPVVATSHATESSRCAIGRTSLEVSLVMGLPWLNHQSAPKRREPPLTRGVRCRRANVR